MKEKKPSIFEAVVLYFPVIILLFQGLKIAYEKYQEIKAAQNAKPVADAE